MREGREREGERKKKKRRKKMDKLSEPLLQGKRKEKTHREVLTGPTSAKSSASISSVMP